MHLIQHYFRFTHTRMYILHAWRSGLESK